MRALPFLDWEQPAAPALPSAPRYQFQGVLLATLDAKNDDAARQGSILQTRSRTSSGTQQHQMGSAKSASPDITWPQNLRGLYIEIWYDGVRLLHEEPHRENTPAEDEEGNAPKASAV